MRKHVGPDGPSLHAVVIGRRLKELRERQGWTLREVGVRVHLTHQQVSKIERGLVDAPLGTIARLAEVLGTTVEGLFTDHPLITMCTTRFLVCA